MKRVPLQRHRGRPRAFDADKALDQAMRIFWKHGYEAASLPELTRAMGINRPSLYAAFGNKESLFRKALDRYTDKASELFGDALAQPNARAVVERLFRNIATSATNANPRGCLLVQGALSCSQDAAPIKRELAKRRSANEALLRQRFEQAKKENDLPRNSNPAALAKFVSTFQHGLAVQLASGASRESLLGAVEIALSAWPQ